VHNHAFRDVIVIGICLKGHLVIHGQLEQLGTRLGNKHQRFVIHHIGDWVNVDYAAGTES
jgi:hypothetical protein